jgi:flavin reductase (DIM6/NTAB) family NADH-FMN oxidoreductase RutF
VTIHSDHPFRDPDPDPVRRFRGRIGGGVTLWTSADGAEQAGLTVTSVMVAGGERAHLVALLDPDSDLAETFSASGTAVVQLLRGPHQMLAEMFAGVAPAPGGPFAQAPFGDTDWGPRLLESGTWAGVRLVDDRPVGWSTLVTCAVEHLEVAEEDDTLLHHRGRYVVPRG